MARMEAWFFRGMGILLMFFLFLFFLCHSREACPRPDRGAGMTPGGGIAGCRSLPFLFSTSQPINQSTNQPVNQSTSQPATQTGRFEYLIMKYA
ncbi:MAG: hypothetical protein DRP83_03960 [Planctomycetota bacterium]|nr:MAG: hypothetical protein DRP83_03960 [Planctomycetota bacterium]